MSGKIAKGYTVEELNKRMPDDIPPEYITSAHLVYNSPAALAFNSPGAEGFGVKRAGLAVPGSIMLIVSPGCCGRNTSDITRIKGYEDRFFYLEISETDLVTARHLNMIPRAVAEIIGTCRKKPSLVMICITCVDALLGTDMERVARKTEESVGIPVRPCYMYALTREGRRPPMVAVRQSLYSLLPKQKRKASSVNLLGFFAPVDPESELFDILRSVGAKRIRQISTCVDIDEYYRMGEANFNLVLNPDARDAANDLQSRLKIPSIELNRFYGTGRIARQYRALAGALGISVKAGMAGSGEFCGDTPQRAGSSVGEDPQHAGSSVGDDPQHAGGSIGNDPQRAGSNAGGSRKETSARLWDFARAEHEAEDAWKALKQEYPDIVFSVGEVVNGNPYELALSLIEDGFRVREIFAGPSPEYAFYIRRLAELSPETMVYSNMEPTMIYYCPDRENRRQTHVTLGKDAAFYHQDAVHVLWCSDEQPWGFAASRKLAQAIRGALAESMAEKNRAAAKNSMAEKNRAATKDSLVQSNEPEGPDSRREDTDCAAAIPAVESHETDWQAGSIRGLRKFLTPFAPDQSGAESVLYELGGIIVILDAGGCAGNICGFDEPRWSKTRSAVFSAGLRDMDAVMGRDRLLVKKVCDCVTKVEAKFVAIIGTPVPAVIGTDLQAVKRMLEKRINVPVITVKTDGMHLYDRGVSLAYQALLQEMYDRGEHLSPAGQAKNTGDCPPPAGQAKNTGDCLSPAGQAKNTGDCPSPAGQAKNAGDCPPPAGQAKSRVGVFGVTPLDLPDEESADMIREALQAEGFGQVILYGSGADLEDYARAGENVLNIAASPDGVAAVKFLKEKFGTPYEVRYPGAGLLLKKIAGAGPAMKRRAGAGGEENGGCFYHDSRNVLIVHGQVLGRSLRDEILNEDPEARVTVAGWFSVDEKAGDIRLKEEEDFISLVRDMKPDLIIGDRGMQRMIPEYRGEYIHLPQFAVSGKREVISGGREKPRENGT